MFRIKIRKLNILRTKFCLIPDLPSGGWRVHKTKHQWKSYCIAATAKFGDGNKWPFLMKYE